MAAPATPNNFYAQQGNGQVYLSWDIMAGATAYKVNRSVDGITYALVASPTVPNYLDTAVTVGAQYYYTVQAANGTDLSPATGPQAIVPVLSGMMTLGQIRLLAQQKADRVNSNFVTLPEWNVYINQSMFELYDELTTLYEDYYLAPVFSFLTDGSTVQWPLPPNFYKLVGVDLGLDNSVNAWVTVQKFDFIERNRYVYPNISSTYLGVFNMRYRLMGNTLYFIPTPSANQTVRVWFIPRLNQLLKDTDQADGVNGWVEIVAVDAAIKALQKEESDVSVLMAQKQMLLDRIRSSGMNRDAGQPDTISATRRGDGNYGGPGWDGSFGGY